MKEKFKSRLQNSIVDTRRKFKSPGIYIKTGGDSLAQSAPNLDKQHSEIASAKKMKSVYKIHKNRPMASFRNLKFSALDKNPVQIDKFGNKLAFGSNNFFTFQSDSRRESLSKRNITSRGTVLRMFSESESDFNQGIPDINLKMQQRNQSQPPIPNTNVLIDNRIDWKPVKMPTIKNALANFPEIKSRDQLTTPSYVGEEAYSNYYKKYRRLSKEKEISPNGYSATTAYLTKWEQMQLSPLPIGILRWDGEETEINAENYLMGKNYAMALSNSMKYLNTEKLNLQSNNLGMQGAAAIIPNLSMNLTELDLSKNNMGSEVMGKLVSWFETMPGKWKLTYLNLSSNKFSDKSLYQLSESLIVANPPLIKLNLSHNSLGEHGWCSLGDFVRQSNTLQSLWLQWNKIFNKGGIYLCEWIAENTAIKNLDLSWNMMGSKENKNSEALIVALTKIVNAGSLIHLDISYNSFKKVGWALFGELIRNNNTLYGLHMQGNQWMVDTYGVVRTEKKYNPEEYGKTNWIGYHSTDGRSVQIKEKKLKIAKIRSHTHCWIWEGWRQEKFVLTAGKSHKKLFDPVYIHFDFDDYKPDLMTQKKQKDGYSGQVVYELYRMVPPGKTLYFYTVNHEYFYAQDQPKLQNKIKMNIKNIEFYEEIEDDGRPPESDEEEEESVFSYSLGIMNYTSGKPKSVIDEEYNPKNKHCFPRPPDKVYIKPRNRRPKTPWSFPISIFKDYQMETEELLTECFEFDWSCLKLPKMTDEELLEIKTELRKGYKIFKSAYKYLAGVGTGSGGGVFSIPLNCYTDFVKQIDLVNGKDIRFAESDTLFLTQNKRNKTSYLNPGVALVRYQFLEVLSRLALKRYEDTKLANSKGEAIKMMYERNLYPFYGKDDPQKFRDEKYWVEEVDNIFKSHILLFEYLYKNYGGTHMKPGDTWFMTTDELESIFADAGLIGDQLVSRDIAVFYNLSMMTQVDEINKDKHLRMRFIEFLEAFARWANQISADPFEKEANKKSIEEKKEATIDLKRKTTKKIEPNSVTLRTSMNDAELDVFEDALPSLSKEEREAQPLSTKIENIMPRIFMSWTNNAFKEKWDWPAIDPYTGLYVETAQKKRPKPGQSFSQTMSSKKMNKLLKPN
jgi:NLR family CARD domain-containing protein 3